MWDQYSSEIGTQDGPLRHVDENEQYPHLNGFVALDMEHWWAERSISAMMKTETTDCIENKTSQETMKKSTLDHKEFLLSSALKKSAFKRTTVSHKTNTTLSSTMPQFHNNFNLCFS